MKYISKKIAIFSMIGLIQMGLGVSAMEASPRQNDPVPMGQQYNEEHGSHERERLDHPMQDKIRAENQRHEQEMKRRPHENKKHWHERQKQEMERHERELHKIKDHR